MNRRPHPADHDDVGTWLSKVKQALNGEGDVAAQVRMELHALQRSRGKLSLDVKNQATSQVEVLASVIEHVRDGDIVISQPSLGAFTRQLATGEQVRISFASSNGLCSGESRVLGRIKMQSGGKGLFFGYRLAIPERLNAVDRREHRRIKMSEGSGSQVHLATVSPKGSGISCVSVSGSIIEMSQSGMQVKLDGSAGPINPGSSLMLMANFPPPVGQVNHPVKVARFDHDPQTGVTRLGLKFEAPIPNLGRFLALYEQRSARRG